MYIAVTLYCAKASNVSKVYIAITFVLFKDVHPMSVKLKITITFVLCAKTSNVKKVYIVITFVLCDRREDIQYQRSLHCMVSLLYCAKTTNVRKVYIGITFVPCEDIQCQRTLYWDWYHFYIVRKIECLESL